MPDKRVEFKFERRFLDGSENGVTFAYLKEEYGKSASEVVINLARLIYLPMALAESGASREAVEKASKKAREFVNEKTMAALGSCVDPSLNGFATTTSAEVTSVQMLAPSKPSWSAQADDDNELYQLDENKIY
jgi:hypothetical protein